MAIIIRYFSTSGAGAADGTTWADRAALFSGGVYSSILTAQSFAADSMIAYIGPGTYSITANITFSSTAPTVAFPLIFHGCDSSGNALTPPDSDWLPDAPDFDDSGFPALNSTTNILTLSHGGVAARMIKFTASGTISAGTAGPVTNLLELDWCSVTNTTADTDAIGAGGVIKISNSQFYMNSTTYRCAILASATCTVHNVKVRGSAGTTGTRHGIEMSAGTNTSIIDVCVSGVGGDAIVVTSATAAHYCTVHNVVAANVGGNGIKLPSTASQTNLYQIDGVMVTGCGAWGIDGQSAARCMLTRSRFRDNTSGDVTGLGSWPTSLDIYTTDGFANQAAADAAEYVNSGANNFQIRRDATIRGRGFGISEQSRLFISSGNFQGGLQS